MGPGGAIWGGGGGGPDVVLVCGKPHVGARERNLPPDVGTRGTTPLPDVGTRRHTSMSGTSEQLGMRPRCSDPTFAGEVFKNTQGEEKNCIAHLPDVGARGPASPPDVGTRGTTTPPDVGTRRPNLPPHTNTWSGGDSSVLDANYPPN